VAVDVDRARARRPDRRRDLAGEGLGLRRRHDRQEDVARRHEVGQLRDVLDPGGGGEPASARAPPIEARPHRDAVRPQGLARGGEQSWLYVFTGGNRWIVSAAEGFVLLSGFTMGMVHHRTIHVKGVRAMLEKVFGRAWLLYALTVVLTIAFAAVSTALGAPYVEQQTPAHGRLDFAVSVL